MCTCGIITYTRVFIPLDEFNYLRMRGMQTIRQTRFYERGRRYNYDGLHIDADQNTYVPLGHLIFRRDKMICNHCFL